MRVAPFAALAVSAFALAGCGGGGVVDLQGADVSQGKQLFTQRCSACHTLKDANAQGKVGPDLDAAFGSGRAQGFAESTIAQVVADQIRYPGQYGADGPTMPPNIVKGEDVDSVAAYVASVAGRRSKGGGGGQAAAPPGSTTSTPSQTGQTKTQPSGGQALTAGRALFKTNCAGCHTLSDASTNGKVGPNLDDLKPDEQTVQHQVTNGGGAMPPFKGTLSPEQIETVAKYVSSVAGK
jgi:mono/diheme cytochrome c family protein